MAKSSSTRPTGNRSTGKSSRRRPPPPVTSRPKPWGLIAGAVVVVLFAASVIGYAINKNVTAAPSDPAALASAAEDIPGIVLKDFAGGQHNSGPIKYESLPPFGGPHNPVWADCTGTVYDKPIRDENAVHALEHGSVWITYRPDLPKKQVDTLKDLVDGRDHMLMSPYPGLKSAVSLQSWGHQLFVDSASDKRVKEFITDLRQNPQTTPEFGANCRNPDFAENPAPPDQNTATQSASSLASTQPTTPMQAPTQSAP